MGNIELPWEIGSEFHWFGIPDGPVWSWPQPYAMFALGRHAVYAIWMHVNKDGSSRRLLVPDYFCPEVIEFWIKSGIPVIKYTDSPMMSHPEWNGVAIESGDVVLAVNYFGVRDDHYWQSWRRGNAGVLLIENHTHDPFSQWALKSTADFCFASLRKTMPVPDGAIVWSPQKQSLPTDFGNEDWRGSSLKLAAMILKKEYLHRGDEEIKDCYRNYQLTGEKIYSESGCFGLSPWSRFILDAGYAIAWRAQRESNVSLLLQLIGEKGSVKPLFTSWPSGHCPFNAVLLFSSEEERDTFRNHCTINHVYTAIHWTMGGDALPASRNLAGRLLTIPVDQRYGVEDIRRIAAIINESI